MNPFFSLEISDPEFENLHVRHITVKSAALRQRADITLFVPPVGQQQLTDLPVVILLHGVYGSHWAWTFNGGLHKTALRLILEGKIRPMIVVMPSDGLWGDGSGYLPIAGLDFERWIVDEVIAATIEVVPTATHASPLFIAGLSMGGFGALRLAAKFPERFRACSGHSSITEFDQLAQFVEEDLSQYRIADQEKTIIAFMRKNHDKLPAMRFDCGTGDPLLAANRKLHQDLSDLGIRHIYEEFEGGHDWQYWRRNIEISLQFFDRLL